jgi:hypothetical protein
MERSRAVIHKFHRIMHISNPLSPGVKFTLFIYDIWKAPASLLPWESLEELPGLRFVRRVSVHINLGRDIQFGAARVLELEVEGSQEVSCDEVLF